MANSCQSTEKELGRHDILKRQEKLKALIPEKCVCQNKTKNPLVRHWNELNRINFFPHELAKLTLICTWTAVQKHPSAGAWCDLHAKQTTYSNSSVRGLRHYGFFAFPILGKQIKKIKHRSCWNTPNKVVRAEEENNLLSSQHGHVTSSSNYQRNINHWILFHHVFTALFKPNGYW